jgi:hypothetical protein
VFFEPENALANLPVIQYSPRVARGRRAQSGGGARGLCSSFGQSGREKGKIDDEEADSFSIMNSYFSALESILKLEASMTGYD